MGDPERRARARLTEMAATDAEVGVAAAAAIRDLYGEEPPALQAAAGTTARVSGQHDAPAARWPADPGAMRGIFFPTAFTRPLGEAAWTIFDVGHWTFDYGATDQIEIGVQTGPPVGALLVAPQAKFAIHARSASVGLFAFGGAFIPVVGDLNTVLFYGGGPMVTIGSPDRFVNMGVQNYFVSTGNDGVALLVPNAGGSARLGRRFRASLEIFVPDVVGDQGEELDPGDIILINYGVRFVGSRLWGDLAFVYPVCDDCGEVTDVLPLGLPLLGIGLTW